MMLKHLISAALAEEGGSVLDLHTLQRLCMPAPLSGFAALPVQGNVAQILGIRGGDKESNIWKIRLQLMKPVTWVPLIWGELPVC